MDFGVYSQRCFSRRGGRAAECVGLENRNTGNGIKGSNPFLSAFQQFVENTVPQVFMHKELVAHFLPAL